MKRDNGIDRRPCPWSDAVIARFLDGEIVFVDREARGEPGGPDVAPTLEELERHRAECPLCDAELAAARRIDALVASGSSVHVSAEQADSWLDAARDRVSAEITTGKPDDSTTPRSLRRLVAAAGLVGIGFAAAWLVRGDDAIEMAPPTVVADDTPDSGLDRVDRAKQDWIELPEVSARRASVGFRRSWVGRLRTRGDVDRVVAICDRLDTTPLPALAGLLRTCGLGWLPVNEALTDAAVVVAGRTWRLRLSAAVLDSNLPVGRLAVRRWLANWADGPELHALQVRARAHRQFRRELASALGPSRVESDVVRCATRLGSPDVDRALREWAVEARDRADTVAEALRGLTDRPGCVSLVLGLWRDQEQRGRVFDAFDLAKSWFVELPGDVTADLCAELGRSRNADHRVRCLLAIAAMRDPRAAERLLEFIDGPRVDDAQLAAFALGRMASAEPLLYEHRSRRRTHLRLAALAMRRDTRLAVDLANLSLTPEERQFLALGGFNFAQFEIATALFRGRAGAVGD